MVAERQEGALGPYLRALRANRLLVAVIPLLCLAAAIAYTHVRSPSYQATAEILLTPLPQDNPTFLGLSMIHDSNDPARTAQTAATLVDSPAAEVLTARHMGKGWNRTRVSQAISVQPQGQSNILDVTATASSAADAAGLANNFVQSALQARRQQLAREVSLLVATLQGSRAPADRDRVAQLQSVRNGQDPTLSISQLAPVPTTQSRTAGWVLDLVALVAGFALASGVALLMEAVNQRLREADELLELLPLPVLARVPKLTRRQRRGREVTSMPPGVREAFRTLQVQIDSDADAGRVLMLTSATTGDGKTTSSINLALALVAAGHRVVLMDFDLRKPDVTRALGLRVTRGLVSLLGSDETLADLLVPAPQLPPLSVVPAGTGEGDALLLGALSRRLPEIMEEARSLADYVIIDTAPLGEVSDALRILPHVDGVLVVSRLGNTLRPNYELMRDLLGRAGRTPNGLVVIGTSSRHQSTYYTYGQYNSGRGRVARASQS